MIQIHHLMRAVAIAAAILLGATSGCVSNTLHNAEREQYLASIHTATDTHVGVDLAVIEFDEFGMLWLPDQLEDTISLIEQRNGDSQRGVIVVTYTHGWMNNADPTRDDNDLARFREGMSELGRQLKANGPTAPDHVIGIYIGWRGATNRVPVLSHLSFWSRKDAAERVASYQMREALFRITAAAKSRPDSKVLLSGHSMGGMILAKTLAPTLSTLLLASGPDGVFAPADLVLLQNPALDGLAAFQLIDFLKRTRSRVELRRPDGETLDAAGPIIASITSEADWVTRAAYPAGQIVDNVGRAFRSDLGSGLPSQGQFANRAHGHMDFLVSHRAVLHDGQVVIEPVPEAYNDTPFWIIRASPEISANHGDIYNPRFLSLAESLTRLNSVYATDVETWIVQDSPSVPLRRAPRGVFHD